ncbi:MAG: hypothetical protein D6814_07830, partial [Calditrichaeota bacterium]
MMPNSWKINILLLGLFAATMAQGQVPNNRAGAFLDYGASARGIALGNAFAAIANDASAAYWNPAGLGQLNQLQLMLSHIRLPFDRTFNFFSTALPFKSRQTFGISWLGLQVRGLEARHDNQLEPDFIFSDSENAFFFSYAYRVSSSFFLGTSIKLLYTRLAQK